MVPPRSHVEFRSDAFPARPGEEQQINPGRWGAALVYPDGFLCFIQPSKAFVRRWFRKINTTTRVGAVADALEAALRANPRIYNLRWWSEKELAR